ncbi:MAG: isoprenylcysteine carboxylmethyltransferase family protein [Desulfobacterales bacterium]
MKIGFDEDTTIAVKIRTVVRAVLFLGIMFAVLFIPAARWDYWYGWTYFLLFVYVYLFNWIFIPSALSRERFKPGLGTKKPLVAALDGGRFHWTGEFPLWIKVLAFAVIFSGYSLEILSVWTNRFFSSTVRIQEDRGHFVIDKGPYAFIRHPGYAASITVSFCIAIGLNSLWALIPAGLYALMFIIRTFLEDNTLQKELPGYDEYAARIKYRLLPGIW